MILQPPIQPQHATGRVDTITIHSKIYYLRNYNQLGSRLCLHCTLPYVQRNLTWYKIAQVFEADSFIVHCTFRDFGKHYL